MKRVVILGSTGSIGKSLLKIISKNINLYNIELLTVKKNYLELFKQAKKFNVKNVILTDKKIFDLHKKKFKDNKINIFNDYNNLDKILNKKVDYVMSSIVGLDGLLPTINLIKHTKNIAIANKETIICAWNLIEKNLKKYNTNFIPVDSEHFSIFHALNKSKKSNQVQKIYLTASGGPLLDVSFKKYKKIKINQVVKHPNWNMGKKISVDSSTMMNKVFEVIEAKKIFDVKYNQLDILIHPDSYIHAIVEFKNKMISIIAHDTTMEIPIFNSINNDTDYFSNSSKLDIKKLNKLSLMPVDLKKFPLVKIINLLPNRNTLFETVLVSANDQLVNLFLEKKIKFTDISSKLLEIVKIKEFALMKKKYPKNINDILKINSYVSSKVKKMCIKNVK